MALTRQQPQPQSAAAALGQALLRQRTPTSRSAQFFAQVIHRQASSQTAAAAAIAQDMQQQHTHQATRQQPKHYNTTTKVMLRGPAATATAPVPNSSSSTAQYQQQQQQQQQHAAAAIASTHLTNNNKSQTLPRRKVPPQLPPRTYTLPNSIPSQSHRHSTNSNNHRQPQHSTTPPNSRFTSSRDLQKGWLYKQSRLRLWNRKWMHLHRKRAELVTHKDKHNLNFKQNNRKIWNIRGAAVHNDYAGKHGKFPFSITDKHGKTMRLAAATSLDRERWLFFLNESARAEGFCSNTHSAAPAPPPLPLEQHHHQYFLQKKQQQQQQRSSSSINPQKYATSTGDHYTSIDSYSGSTSIGSHVKGAHAPRTSEGARDTNANALKTSPISHAGSDGDISASCSPRSLRFDPMQLHSKSTHHPYESYDLYKQQQDKENSRNSNNSMNTRNQSDRRSTPNPATTTAMSSAINNKSSRGSDGGVAKRTSPPPPPTGTFRSVSFSGIVPPRSGGGGQSRRRSRVESSYRAAAATTTTAASASSPPARSISFTDHASSSPSTQLSSCGRGGDAAGSPALSRPTDWNGRYQACMTEKEHSLEQSAEKAQKMHRCVASFLSRVTTYARSIVEEYALQPFESRRSDWGRSFEYGGVIFTFSVDDEDEAATTVKSKLATHEMHGIRAYASSNGTTQGSCSSGGTVRNNKTLASPLCTVVDFAGYRLFAMAAMPACDDSTLVAGRKSTMSDGGAYYLNSGAVKLIKDAAKRLNLKPHLVLTGGSGATLHEDDERAAAGHQHHKRQRSLSRKPMLIYSGMDVKFHRCDDRRIYVTNVAGLFPVDLSLSAENASPSAGWKNRLLRQELVASNPVPLSSDSFLLNGVEDHETNDIDTARASQRLRSHVIPAFALWLDKQRPVIVDGFRLVSAMHSSGINARYLGAVYAHCTKRESMVVCAAEMVARAVKVIFRRQLRVAQSGNTRNNTQHVTSKGDMLYSNIRSVTAQIVTCVLDESQEARNFWAAELWPYVSEYFDIAGDVLHKQSSVLHNDQSRDVLRSKVGMKGPGRGYGTQRSEGMGGEAQQSERHQLWSAWKQLVPGPMLLSCMQVHMGVSFRTAGLFSVIYTTLPEPPTAREVKKMAFFDGDTQQRPLGLKLPLREQDVSSVFVRCKQPITPSLLCHSLIAKVNVLIAKKDWEQVVKIIKLKIAVMFPAYEALVQRAIEANEEKDGADNGAVDFQRCREAMPLLAGEEFYYLHTLNQLTRAHLERKEVDAASAVCMKALAMCRIFPAHAETARTFTHAAAIELNTAGSISSRSLCRAQRFHECAVAIICHFLGQDHSRMVEACAIFALLCAQSAKSSGGTSATITAKYLEAAKNAYEMCLQAARVGFGYLKVESALIALKLADVCVPLSAHVTALRRCASPKRVSKDLLEQARTLYMECLDVFRRERGATSLSVAACCFNLSEVLFRLRQATTAVAYSQRALEIRQQQLSGENPRHRLIIASMQQVARLAENLPDKQMAIKHTEMLLKFAKEDVAAAAVATAACIGGGPSSKSRRTTLARTILEAKQRASGLAQSVLQLKLAVLTKSQCILFAKIHTLFCSMCEVDQLTQMPSCCASPMLQSSALDRQKRWRQHVVTCLSDISLADESPSSHFDRLMSEAVDFSVAVRQAPRRRPLESKAQYQVRLDAYSKSQLHVVEMMQQFGHDDADDEEFDGDTAAAGFTSTDGDTSSGYGAHGGTFSGRGRGARGFDHLNADSVPVKLHMHHVYHEIAVMTTAAGWRPPVWCRSLVNGHKSRRSAAGSPVRMSDNLAILSLSASDSSSQSSSPGCASASASIIGAVSPSASVAAAAALCRTPTSKHHHQRKSSRSLFATTPKTPRHASPRALIVTPRRSVSRSSSSSSSSSAVSTTMTGGARGHTNGGWLGIPPAQVDATEEGVPHDSTYLAPPARQTPQRSANSGNALLSPSNALPFSPSVAERVAGSAAHAISQVTNLFTSPFGKRSGSRDDDEGI